jgi:hypothetical protein
MAYFFYTPAPLLQELGLKNKKHTRTAVLRNTHGKPYYGTHTESRIMEQTESRILSLESCYSYTANNTKHVHTTTKGWSGPQDVFMNMKSIV